MQQFSLKGVIQHVLTVAKEYNLRACKAAMDFQTRRNPIVTEEPQLADFPYPVQQLITQQMKLANNIVEDNKELMLLEDENICICSFYHHY